MNLSSPLIDGCKSGVSLESGVLATKKDFQYLKHVFLKYLNGGSLKDSTGAFANVMLHGSMARLKCHEWGGKYYFNADGNPISFLTGQNIVGTMDATSLISKFYTGIGEAITEEYPSFDMPLSITRPLETGEVYINSMAIAAYTKHLAVKDWHRIKDLLNAIDFLYASVYSDQGATVKEWLGVRVVREGPYSLRFDKMKGKNRYWSFSMYDKISEIEEGPKSFTLSKTEFSKRIRLDLTLHSAWFSNNRLKTIRDLSNRVHGDYTSWALSLFGSVMQKLSIGPLVGIDCKMLSSLNTEKYGKELALWKRGKPWSGSHESLEYFARKGVNVKIPFNVLSATALAKEALLADEKTRRLWIEKKRTPLQYKDFMSLSNLMPDQKFPVYNNV